MNKDIITVLEAAYQIDSGSAWISGVVRSAATALGLPGAVAVLYDASNPTWVDIEHMELVDVSPEFAKTLYERPKDTMAPDFSEYLRKPIVSSVLKEPRTRDNYREDFRKQGIDDVLVINAGDPSGKGCMLAFPDKQREYPSSWVALWRRAAAHIASGNRLRRMLTRLAGLAPSPDTAEAVIAPSGRVEHAVGSASPKAARKALQEALVRIDTARSRKPSPERGLELWRGLVSGRWSIVESFERDGKRYYLAYRNDPDVEPASALSKREQQVLAYAALGQSNKLIAYSLGLSLSSVSTLLARARRKLRHPDALALHPDPRKRD
ncbi:MAG: LuxR C-terminal-related transcriptional regulator [Myxococcota bacterium]